MGRYLEVTTRLISEQKIHGAKASTRPDMISQAVMKILKNAGFMELELGIQSMDDDVLASAGRGHTASDAFHASALVKSSGMRLGVQIMPGLPGEDARSFLKTVDAVIGLNPDTARIYPAVVLSGTKLEELYLKGEYQPLSLHEAVSRALYASVRLESRGCTILRMGLPSSPQIQVRAGPYHQSFGFLVRSLGYRIMARRMMDILGNECELVVNPSAITELLGFKRNNISGLRFSYSFDATLPRGYIRGRSGRESACIQLQDILEYIL
jgi:histone acetyltransferase (RNA polymerase elongator complex component)